MKIQRVETKAFSISEGLEKRLERKLTKGSVRRRLRKTLFKEETKIIKSYRPLAKFKVSRMAEVHKGLIGEQTIYETRENAFYVDLSNADLYIVKNGGVERLDLLRKLLNLSPQAARVFGGLLRTSFIYAEKIERNTIIELAQAGFIKAYKSTLLSFFKGLWDELNPEEQEKTEVKERIKPRFRIPAFENKSYDLGDIYLEGDTIDEGYGKDNIKYPIDAVSGVLANLFEAQVQLKGISFLPYISVEYKRTRGGKKKSPPREYPLCKTRSRLAKIKPGKKLKAISLSTAIGSAGSVPLESATIDFDEIGGMVEIKKEIRESLICPLTNPELAKEFGKKCGGAILLYGPPGCGKSYIARATIGEVGIPFFNVNISEIVGKGVEAEAESLHQVFEEAAKNSPAVIFFDELDAIGGRRHRESSYEEKMEVDQFLMEMDGVESLGDDILIIAATNVPWNIDPALRRSVRFTKHIFIKPPDKGERKEIFKIHMKGKPIAEDVDLDRLAGLTEDYSSSDIKAICDYAAEIPWEEAMSSGEGRKIGMDDFLCALQKQKSSLIPWFKQAYSELKASGEENLFADFARYIVKYGGGVEQANKPEMDFSDVGGMEEVKEEIRKLIIYPFKDTRLFEQYKKELGGSLLFYGPPGCGKTYIARATAGEADVAFFNVKLTDIFSDREGESERNIQEIFERAGNNTPAILFFDEIDAITGRRDKLESESGKRMVDAFLTELDGFKKTDGLIIIAATNAPWNIDPALRRSERFTKQIFVPAPDEEARESIFQIHMRDKPASKSIDYRRLSEMTAGYSSSDIKAVCDQSVEIPWQEALKGAPERDVEMKDFIEVIGKHRSSISPWYRSAEKQIGESGEADLYPELANSIAEFKQIKAYYSQDDFQEVLESEKKKIGMRSKEEENEIDLLLKQKAELEKRIELARQKFYKREIDEEAFKGLVREYEKELIESDVKLEILKSKDAGFGKDLAEKHKELLGGRIYLIEESRIGRSARAFMDETVRSPGLWISRTDPDNVEIDYEPGEREVDIRRLMNSEDEYSAPPQAQQLFAFLSDFIEKGGRRVVFIEGLEYLISQNGFDSVLKFIQGLNDKINATEAVVILSMMPEALTEHQRPLIEKETLWLI